jgi:hypothetical protein
MSREALDAIAYAFLAVLATAIVASTIWYPPGMVLTGGIGLGLALRGIYEALK